MGHTSAWEGGAIAAQCQVRDGEMTSRTLRAVHFEDLVELEHMIGSELSMFKFDLRLDIGEFPLILEGQGGAIAAQCQVRDGEMTSRTLRAVHFEDLVELEHMIGSELSMFKFDLRCESMELDNKIRDLIERNASPGPRGINPEATSSRRNSCSPKVAELKTKLDTAERRLNTLEMEQPQNQRHSDRQRSLAGDARQLEEKEKESLNEELHELKKENRLLKEKNVLASRKKEHYECEIKRLNKALQDALKMEYSSVSEDCLGKCDEEMRTEMEVLKQQVQIYEEDFKKERSDRERLNQEKEELQRINQTSQSQLSRLNSQIKACQKDKEKLEKQLKQMYFPICKCGLVFQLRDSGVPTPPRAEHHQQDHAPDYRWYALDQFPPDVQHKAKGKTTAVLRILSCLHSNGIFGGCLLSIQAFVLGEDLLQSCVVYTTLI
ncbi:TNFAIP3-interacting protein 3 [Tupaia chinensis]|uniref:TNFAIP3-interacting protein 3 n=1 Tax=Tupaia chinensis TaxID=246437 RepID=L9KJG2_TUPCH|nr:TNFAIP3-interacting protein 3 [Tupaia chinensis]